MLDETVACDNEVNEEGIITGGTVAGVGIDIKWQDGPLGRAGDRVEPNGAFVETVIYATIKRLEAFQNSKFKCAENEDAIRSLQTALDRLDDRTRSRESQEVEGTYGQRKDEGEREGRPIGGDPLLPEEPDAKESPRSAEEASS